MRIAGKKISYVPLGIETPRFLARDEAMRLLAEKIPELKEVGSGPRIVSIAELTPNKGLNFGIEAVARLRDRGVIAIGRRADLVAFDAGFRPVMTMVGGRVVYERT